jgi:hypothetical protein
MHHPDIEPLRSALRDRAGELGEAMLGAPSYRGRAEWRWGRRGSLALVVSGERRGQWFDHERGEGGDLLDLVQRERRCGFPEALAWALAWLGEAPLPKPPERREARQRPPEGQREGGFTIRLARRLWAEAVPAHRTLAADYLRSRGLTLPEDCEALRFHPHAWRNRDNGPIGPAMVAAMTCPVSNEWRGTHVTYLRPDGTGKAEGPSPKVMLGRAGVIRISPDDDVTAGLGIAEGIETTLAVMQHADWRPMWCATSAGAIASFPVLNGIEALTIFADTDAAGQRAAETCARRWAEAGREAFIITPREGDWNDVVTREVRP